MGGSYSRLLDSARFAFQSNFRCHNRSIDKLTYLKYTYYFAMFQIIRKPIIVETGEPLSEVLLRDSTIRNTVNENQLCDALNLAYYTGHCVTMTRDAALRAQKAALLLQT